MTSSYTQSVRERRKEGGGREGSREGKWEGERERGRGKAREERAKRRKGGSVDALDDLQPPPWSSSWLACTARAAPVRVAYLHQ